MLSVTLEETIVDLRDAQYAVMNAKLHLRGSFYMKIPNRDTIALTIERVINKLVAEEKSRLALAAHWAEHSA